MERAKQAAGVVVPSRVWSDDVLALCTAGRLVDLGDIEGAERMLAPVLRSEPIRGEAWFYLGVIRQRQGRLDEARSHFEKALLIMPDLAEARNNLAVLHQARGRLDEAETLLREALSLEPDYADAWNNLGNVLQDRGRFADAVDAYRSALVIQPRSAEALRHLGNALRALGRPDEAIACYDEGLRIAPDHSLLHMSRAMVRLEQGDHERGWPECAWRLTAPDLFIHRLRGPAWDGRDLAGRTLLIVGEQGLGDTIQFLRYAPLIAGRGTRVVVVCDKSLRRVLATCPGVASVAVEGEVLPDYAGHAAVMSLPAILGTTLATIPAEVPYLGPDREARERWGGVLDRTDDLKVGVIWQGNPAHTRDRERSFRLAELAPVAAVPGVRLVALQKGPGRTQLSEVPNDWRLTDLGDRLDDFADTAAVMERLDLVISADSSPAHLAGALGVPVWVPLPFVADWRWMTGRDDSPWYPSMRLFRQERFGDWGGVFSRIARALAECRSLGSRRSSQ